MYIASRNQASVTSVCKEDTSQHHGRNQVQQPYALQSGPDRVKKHLPLLIDRKCSGKRQYLQIYPVL